MSLEEEIVKRLENNQVHILSYQKSFRTSYYDGFIESLNKVKACGFVSSNRNKDALMNKLLLGKKQTFNADKYLQGISEFLFGVYAANKGLEIKTDCKINPDNNNDVDVRIKAGEHLFNIEVKCPTQDDLNKDRLSLGLAYRMPGVSKDEVDITMTRLEDLIQSGIDSHPEMGITGSDRKKTNDNKIITFMDSAQSKFVYSDMDMNILVISVPSKEMQAYYSYLCNPYSGILTYGIGEFGRCGEDFDKIDLILLTNIVSGHDKEVQIDTWNLDNYCSIGFINPFSIGIQKKTKPLTLMLDILPDEGIQFQKERKEILCRDLKRGIPADEMLMFEYLAIHHKELYRPDEKRIPWFKDGQVNSAELKNACCKMGGLHEERRN